MPSRIQFPQWRRQNEATKYPFTEAATLTADDGAVLLEGTFLDAALYPVGANGPLRLSKAVLTHAAATLYVGDAATDELAAGTFDLVGPPDVVALADAYGRPAGVLVTESLRLAAVQAWGVGTHAFGPAAAPFVAAAQIPTPEVGVRGFLLDDGTLLTGDVWVVGDDGVVVRAERVTLPGGCGPDEEADVVRIDVVGDPLFRRRLCQPRDLFAAPNPVRALRVVSANGTFECTPDDQGEIKLVAHNGLRYDTVLRVRPGPGGLTVEAVGQVTDNR